jgi:putative phosphoesterase
MRIAIIADIHANLVALEAVLAQIERDAVAQIVCLGDLASRGPHPAAVVERVRALGIAAVRGNTDRRLPELRRDEIVDGRPEWMVEVDRWCAAQLSNSDVAYMQALPESLRVALGGIELFCCHGSPRSDEDNILPGTPVETLDAWLAGITSDVIVVGHTHESMVRRHRDITIVNPGSVGAPFDRSLMPQHYRVLPWAEYALVSWAAGLLSVDLRRIALDVAELAQAAMQSGMPHNADWFAERR